MHGTYSAVECGGAGMTKFDYLQLFALQVERISVATKLEGTGPGKRGSQKELMNAGLIWCCIARDCRVQSQKLLPRGSGQ
jgi:hypothetical protein